MTRLCKDPFISVKEITSYMETSFIHFGRCVGFPILFILLIFLFQDNFYIVIETYHIGDRGEQDSASKSSIRRFVITEKAPTRAFSWLKAATTAFTFKTLLRHYAKRALTPRSLNVKLGPRRNYANQPARPLWLLRRGPNFTLRDRGVNARLA